VSRKLKLTTVNDPAEQALAISKVRKAIEIYDSETQLTILRDTYTSIANERTADTIQKFKIGDRVWWNSKWGRKIHGVVTKINQKTVSISTINVGGDDTSLTGQKWTVSPSLLYHYETDVSKRQ